MQWVCSKCHYFGKNKNNYSLDDYSDGLFYSICGVILLILGLIFFEGVTSDIFYYLIIIYVLVTGIRRLVRYRKGCICPNCTHKPMLALDSPEAIKLIKQFDLEPGESNSSSTINEPNTSSSFKAPEA